MALKLSAFVHFVVISHHMLIVIAFHLVEFVALNAVKLEGVLDVTVVMMQESFGRTEKSSTRASNLRKAVVCCLCMNDEETHFDESAVANMANKSKRNKINLVQLC